MKSAVNRIIRHFGFEIRRVEVAQHMECVSIKTEHSRLGNVLLAYIVEPFLLKAGESPSRSHTHHAESLLIAQVFLARGYDVDIVDYRNGSFKPGKDYSYFVSARTNFVRLAERLNKDCIKIAHLDTAHFLFNNSMAYRRLLKLQQRRGITNTSIRVIEHNYAVEHADYLTMLGNQFTLSTYSFAGKPIFPLPVPTLNTFAWRKDKDFTECKNRFLWLGSGGLVHKGLDLVLEVFRETPACQLTVCGPLDAPSEKGFVQAFHRELYETPNIQAIGWVDVGSEQFERIANSCVALIYPSCSEGQAGSVITCLQAGIIPLVSYESGVDVDGFGTILEECSHEQIRKSIMDLVERSNDELADLSLKACEYAKQNHSTESYRKAFDQVISQIERGKNVQ